MVGSRQNAHLALSGALPLFSRGEERFIFRVDDVVYKVDRDGAQSNEEDWAMHQALAESELPSGVALPEMQSYVFDGSMVLAVKFIEGRAVGACPPVLERLEGRDWQADTPTQTCPANGSCIDDALAKTLFDEFNVTDLHCGNLLQSRDGTIWLIDLF
ncbi:hypothetical protein GCM10027425_02300 [Alteromonas gracilis]